LWHEMWHEALEEASRLYFGEHNIEGMLAVLDPLHLMLEEGPETLKETAFIQVRAIFYEFQSSHPMKLGHSDRRWVQHRDGHATR